MLFIQSIHEKIPKHAMPAYYCLYNVKLHENVKDKKKKEKKNAIKFRPIARITDVLCIVNHKQENGKKIPFNGRSLLFNAATPSQNTRSKLLY